MNITDAVSVEVRALPFAGRAGYLRWYISMPIYITQERYPLAGYIVAAPSGNAWCVVGVGNALGTIVLDRTRPWWQQPWVRNMVYFGGTMEEVFAYAATWPGVARR